MQKHSMNCEYRLIRCSYCSSMISFINKDNHYEDHCSAFWREKREEIEKQLAWTEDGVECPWCEKR